MEPSRTGFDERDSCNRDSFWCAAVRYSFLKRSPKMFASRTVGGRMFEDMRILEAIKIVVNKFIIKKEVGDVFFNGSKVSLLKCMRFVKLCVSWQCTCSQSCPTAS